MIKRRVKLSLLANALDRSLVVALLGPRQCGKTTLAGELAESRECETYDLENPRDAALLSNPLLALEKLGGTIVLDEIQREPELFEIIRVLVDRPDNRARFLLLGSASPALVADASESLAGRVSFVDLSGFDLCEAGGERFERLWLRGGFPLSYLAEDANASFLWREDFVRTFLERDVPQLGIGSIPAKTLRRFWTMIAHYHGQVWNASEIARSLGTGEAAARRYIDVLDGAYMVRQLQPWHANVGKRQVRSPKVYVRDTGILHALLTLETREQLLSHPKCGASFEGFVIEQIAVLSRSRNLYFWATHAGAELDLLLFRGGRAVGFEVKTTDAPTTTKSMRVALRDLDLEHLYVVYPGDRAYELDDRISVLPVTRLPDVL
ncbi:MAG: ATP-binding protein [Polyangia bacterium]